MVRESFGEKICDVIIVIIMIAIIIVVLYPLLYILFVSFSVPAQYMRFRGEILWHPLGFSIASYKMVFKNPNILSGYKNTILIILCGVSLNMVMTIIGGYVLSRQQLMLRKFLTLLTLFTMYFSGGLIPTYLTVRNLRLDNTFWALIFPVAINTFNLIIMRTAFENVPSALEESAKIDGASHFVILTKIMVPLVPATLAVLTLYYTVDHWNSWFNALIYLRNRKLYPLQLILRELLMQDSAAKTMQLPSASDDDALIAETIKYATIVVATVPILVVYPFLQRYFVSGVMIGAVKG